jgi:subtilisin-like proprotein convertase family protein
MEEDAIMNRRSFVAGGLASLAFPGLAVAKKTKPKFKTRVITKSFRNKGLIAINGGVANPYPSKIQVKGFPRGKIKKVEVLLHGVSHQQPNEMQMLLQSPRGRKTLLMRYACGSNSFQNLNILLKQNAPAPLPDGNSPDPFTSGAYKPAAYLALQPFPAPAPQGVNSANLGAFKNSKADGTWKLYVHDIVPAHTGQIAGGWTLKIKAQVKQRVK